MNVTQQVVNENDLEQGKQKPNNFGSKRSLSTSNNLSNL